MIDLSQLTEEQINELELQIQKHKELKPLKKLKGYKVTFYVGFYPENHEYDKLTDCGKLDPDYFSAYLYDNVITGLIRNFDLNGYEDVSYPLVQMATEQEIEQEF
jgi:hypothetical protein